MQSSTRNAIRGKSKEIENWVSIEFQSQQQHYIHPGFKAQGKRKKQANLHKEAQSSSAGLVVEGEEGERASTETDGSSEQSTEKDSSASSSLGISKLRSKLV